MTTKKAQTLEEILEQEYKSLIADGLAQCQAAHAEGDIARAQLWLNEVGAIFDKLEADKDKGGHTIH